MPLAERGEVRDRIDRAGAGGAGRGDDGEGPRPGPAVAVEPIAERLDVELTAADRRQGDDPPPADPGATDNCDPDPSVLYSEVKEDGPCEDSYTLSRQWTARDRCGNEATGTQVITVLDRTAPVLWGIPDEVGLAVYSG